MIRLYSEGDELALKRIHAASGLPENCFPDLTSPLFIVKLVAEEDGRVVQFGGIRVTSEAFVLIDHETGTADGRWQTLQELTAHALNSAARRNVEQVTAWIPPSLESSFAKRLEALGFTRSKWNSYTANLR